MEDKLAMAIPPLDGVVMIAGEKVKLALTTLTCVLVFLGVAACVYRVAFHPLAKYPGPFLAKFTNLYAGYHAWTGDIHEDVYRCHLKYGDHVRYGPNRLMFNTANALQDIYGRKSQTIKFKNYEILSRQAANLLTLRDKTLHAKRRRVVSQAFSGTNLREFEPAILSKIDRFCNSLRRVESDSSATGRMEKAGWSGTMDMAQKFNQLAFDIMTTLTFNSDFNAINSPEYRFAVHAIELSNVRLGVLLQAPELAIANLDKKLFPKSIAGRHQFVKFIRLVLSERLKKGKQGMEEKDIFSFLQSCRDPDTGSELTPTELSTETATFIIAGADTSSTSMAAISHYLTGSSSCYRRVAEEVRSAFSSIDEIRTGPALNSCVFLRACIDEALRLSPPAGAPLWREVEEGGTVIDEHFIPAACVVGVGVYSIHHNAKYYQNPFTYDPQRWLTTSPPDAANTGTTVSLEETSDRGATPYMPFSTGPRSCVGKPLALASTMLTFARLFWEFDFGRADQPADWFEGDHQAEEYKLKDHITGWKEGPFLRFSPRGSTL